MQNILSAAEGILGTAVRVEAHRDWAIFWCPFHNDASREGQGGQPNFGVNLQSGYWKCLRCGARGGSLKSLQDKLGRGYTPPVSDSPPTRPKRPPTQVQLLDEAVSEARACVQTSPAWSYLQQRGVTPYTALVYGLGYGIPVPRVHREIMDAAKQSMMVRRDGTWLWAGGVVYADPPTHPDVMNVRNILSDLDPRDCRVGTLKARASALKWLLVVCFGYLGYKNARFGKIESHEAVTAMSRELMLQAKEVAEDMGFTVLHMYVDCLFVQQEGFRRPSDFTLLMNAIEEKTGIPIALEGVFKWVAFLASKRDARVPVPNQYFGAFQDRTLKYRGIELRRRDTTTWVRKIQFKVLEVLAGANTPREFADRVPEVMALVERAKQELVAGRVPLDELIIRQKLSRSLDGYKSPSPVARAALQLQAKGRLLAPGQSMEFLFVRNGSGVHAWELEEAMTPVRLDTKRYSKLLDRAVRTVLDPCKPFLVSERLL